MEFEWNIFAGFNTLQLSEEVKRLLFRLQETPANITGRILCMSKFTDISCGTKDNEEECLTNARLVSLYARRFGKGQWSFIGPGSEKSGTLSRRQSTRNVGQNCRKMLRLHCPEVNSKAKDMVNCRYTLQPTRKRLRLFFAKFSANQLSLYGAVAKICEEYESLHERTGRPVVMGQSSSSLMLSAIKTEVLLDSDDPACKNFLLQQEEERIERLSQQDKLSKFCMDAGFLNVVENGQYFTTKDTGDLTQFHAVACREYTLPREEAASQPKGWTQGNTKIGLVLEVAASYLHAKHGVEVRIMSLSRDNTHSWVRIFMDQTNL